MKIVIFLICGLCTLAAHADSQDTSAHGGESVNGEATQAIVRESSGEMGESASDQAAEPAESPWQGSWTGSELNASGTRVRVTARIRITNGKISGSWNARGAGSKPITGQVNGKEASITILQGGSNIKATLVEKDKIEYSGLRGFGTLSRR
jgi:hypothetical protein